MHADLIIVGAGMVGSTLALALKDSGLTILVVDGSPLTVAPFNPTQAFAPRVSAVLQHGQVLFNVAPAPIAICMCGMAQAQARFTFAPAAYMPTYSDILLKTALCKMLYLSNCMNQRLAYWRTHVLNNCVAQVMNG